MSTTTQKSSLLARLTKVVHVMALRAVDATALTNRRIAELENRLAELDHGDDASAAIVSAMNAVNERRVAAGAEPLALSTHRDESGRVSGFVHTSKMPDA